jgi:predicted metal-dependent HD superfamily phosphohydrolase
MSARTDISHWRTLWNALEAWGDPAPWHRLLVGAYSDDARHYHNLEHLEECLSEFDRVRSTCQHPVAVEVALWFHDAVYDPRSNANEEKSAALAVDCLDEADVLREPRDIVRQLILSTKTHEPGDVPDAALLIDIDLAILGQPAARFWEYEQAIRAEYAWVPEVTFAQKRTEILVRFLGRSAIYRTEAFRARYESIARANLEAAIGRLRALST